MRITFILGIVLLLVNVAIAETGFDSQEKFSNWLTYYYLRPEPEKVPSAIKYMSQNGMLDDGNAIPPVFGFLSGVIKENPEQIQKWINELNSIKEAHLGVLVLGIWYSDLPDSEKKVFAILEDHPQLKEQFNYLYNGSSMPVTKIPLEQGPWVLDALWGHFMATGQDESVLRIIEALPWIDVKGDINRLMVGGAANWSLTSNAMQHKKVMDICMKQVEKSPKDVSMKLKEIITKANEKPNNSVQ